ncbi:hypothetical protein QJQ45_029703 [Haematococcus lacustris]|nr:hypothetical protein QJQ45_029703 [Haematococcus lacustris]
MRYDGESLAGQRCIVTGGNKGIGLEISRGLMARGAHVVIAARDQQACQLAVKELSNQAHPDNPGPADTTRQQLPGSCSCAALDLEDYGSVRAFADQQLRELQGSGKKLDVLVNNAGVMGVAAAADGSDRTMRINHLGPFLLTQLLQPAMGHGCRIVNVSSRMHLQGSLAWSLDGKQLVTPPRDWWWPQYCRSKLANVMFTAELQRRWGSGPQAIKATSVSPGFVSTGIMSMLPWPLNLAQPLSCLVARTPAQGAETAVFAALPTTQQLPLFLHDCKPMKPAAVAQDPAACTQLWEWSERMVGLHTPTAAPQPGPGHTAAAK